MFAHIVWPTWRRVGCIDAATAKLSDFVRLVKTNSSFEANRRITGSLKWGRGYYVTTIHKNDVVRVRRYVERQFDRHPDRIPRGSPKQVL